MGRNVAQRFLGNSIQAKCGFLRYAIDTGGGESHVDPVLRTKLRAMTSQSRDQTGVLQHAGVEFVG